MTWFARVWPPGRLGWLTFLLLGAVLVVNGAGVWAMTMARRGIEGQIAHTLYLETDAQARGLESVLAGIRADLVFLSNSPAFSSVSPERLEAVGGAMILFLRGHPAVTRLALLSPQRARLVEAGRPRGVPGYWLPSHAGAQGADPAAEGSRPHVTHSQWEVRATDAGAGSPPVLRATLDLSELLSAAALQAGPGLFCSLQDARGSPLASLAAGAEASARKLQATARFTAEGWSAASPWQLSCARSPDAVLSLEPLATRYRSTIALNLAIMAVTMLLGFFAIQEARQRQWLEYRTRENARVREIERQLFHAERLSTVGRLAAGMAHEINNPLEGMSNYLRLAREALERGQPAAADHAQGSATPGTAADLNEILSHSVAFVRSREEFSAIRFDLDLAPDGATVQGSPVMLGQVFLNLLLNACEAQPGGGQISVRSRSNGFHVRAEIADRGPGVPASERGRIFEPFHSTKQSTGLGLSICHSIVKQHEGELSVEDREGGGAVFVVRLPARREADDAR
jgi:signal transduction histidine kinase